MDKNLNESMPIYMQIMDRIRAAVVSGELAPGEKVLPVREMAEQFGVNPNTMQRALSELEREGLLASERTSGRFVTRDTEIIAKTRSEEAEKVVQEFLQKMDNLGFSMADIGLMFHQMAAQAAASKNMETA